MFIKRHLVLVVLSCALYSCSDSLSHEKAAEAIITHYSFPHVEIIRITDGFFTSTHLNKMRDSAITIAEASDLYWRSGRRLNEYRSGLTDKGTKYMAPPEACNACMGETRTEFGYIPWTACMATNIVEFKEITGIAYEEATNTALVDYVVVMKSVNTFGTYTGKVEGKEEVRKATLKHFDDGSWRVQNAKPCFVVKPEQIPFYSGDSTDTRFDKADFVPEGRWADGF